MTDDGASTHPVLRKASKHSSGGPGGTIKRSFSP
jgi:putative transposase